MTRKEKCKMAVVFLLFLILALYKDCTGGLLREDGTVEREICTGEEKEISLTLNAEGILEDYEYELRLEPTKVTEEEAKKFFQQTIHEIEKDFEDFEEKLPIQKKYCEGIVKAKWKFSDRTYVNAQGEILQENIPEKGGLCVVEATLSCGAYEQVYSFAFKLQKKELSQQERLLKDLEQWVEQEMEQEGETEILLPTELNGVSLEWSEKKESLTLQVFVLEIVAGLALLWGRKKQKEQEERSRIQKIEMEYPDVVNQLSMLLETGMTMRQAWNKIAVLYEAKRKHQIVEQSPVLEAVVCMNRRLLEGESERMAYEKFGEEVNVRCYYQLMRTLISHLDKGMNGLCVHLEEECRKAYNQRILTAKKLGEEASTKMLLPLMLMMVLVMVIVLLPAIIEIAV